MLKRIGLLVGTLWISLANSYCTTVPNPSVRYTISNQTSQKVTALIQVESTNQRFLTIDTVGVITDFHEGLSVIRSRHRTLKPYQKLIIQTNQQQYQTASLPFPSRCTAYSIQITKTGLSIQPDYSFIFQRWVSQIFIVFLFILVIKGVPLLLSITSHFKDICKPFFALNGIFGVCILILHNFSFGRPVEAGPIESKYIYLTLLIISLLEGLWYFKSTKESPTRIRVVAGTILGSLLWAFPGYLITLFALFFFARC